MFQCRETEASQPSSSHGIEAPAVEHGGPIAGVPKCDREVDGLIARLGAARPALDVEPLAVGKTDLLRRVVEPGRHQQRPESSEQRTLGGARRFADRTDAKVAPTRTSVPLAVASAEIVTQSAMARVYEGGTLS
jgi:hypothetical protein